MKQSERCCKIRKSVVLIYLLLMAGITLLWQGLYLTDFIAKRSAVYDGFLKVIAVGGALGFVVLLAVVLLTLNIGKLRRIEAEE